MPHEIRKEGRFEALLERFLEDQGEAMSEHEVDIGKALFKDKEYKEQIKNKNGHVIETKKHMKKTKYLMIIVLMNISFQFLCMKLQIHLAL